MTILERVKKNAEKYPERIMMICKDEDIERHITWGQLDEYSDILAAWLDKSLNTKKPVLVYGHKNPIMIVCFLACVKSGRAYCPIDINVPASRVGAIINEVKPEIIFATEEISVESDCIVGIDKIYDVIEHETNVISQDKYVGAEDTFYIIFTSGSTGTPKGVQITRDCLDNFIRWAINLGNGVLEDKNYVFLNQAPFSFDLSVMDLYMCLYSGGTLWALPKKIQGDMKKLFASLGESKANVWVSTPSFADICLSDPIFSEKLMPEITDFLFCGEILTNKTVARLSDRFPNAKIVNTYGPTESTCAITEVVVTPELNLNCVPLPVGKAKPGTWLRIMNEDGTEAKEGDHGEIVIIGDSVSTGYWNNSERNGISFGTEVIDGREYRTYRTGDEGYLIDGMLYYGGRIDLQVKLHGYRIELGDIESNLLKISGVEQAVVIPKYRDGKVSSLAAGLVMSSDIADEKEEVSKIKEELKTNLPEYMVPKK